MKLKQVKKVQREIEKDKKKIIEKTIEKEIMKENSIQRDKIMRRSGLYGIRASKRSLQKLRRLLVLQPKNKNGIKKKIDPKFRVPLHIQKNDSFTNLLVKLVDSYGGWKKMANELKLKEIRERLMNEYSGSQKIIKTLQRTDWQFTLKCCYHMKKYPGLLLEQRIRRKKRRTARGNTVHIGSSENKIDNDIKMIDCVGQKLITDPQKTLTDEELKKISEEKKIYIGNLANLPKAFQGWNAFKSSSQA